MTLDWKIPVRVTVSGADKSLASPPFRTDFRPILCD